MPIQEDSTYNEQVVLTVRGENLYGSHYGVYRVADGERVEYTPLGGTFDALEYILQDNGVYEVVANGEVVGTVTLNGVEIPASPFTDIWVGIVEDTGKIGQQAMNEMSSTRGKCINYPVKPTAESPFFYIIFSSRPALSPDDFAFSNAVIDKTSGIGTIYRTFYFRPINSDAATTISVNGVIYFVGNYTN